jgi:hypothetical protein
MNSRPLRTSLLGPQDPSSVLAHALECKHAEEQAARDVMLAGVRWLALHSADSLIGPADGWHEQAMPMGGEGCPEVAEFAIAEWAAAMGLSPDAGRRYLARGAEGRHRLTECWKRIGAGTLLAWKLGMIADRTMPLSPGAAAFVDAHVAPVAHKVGPAQLMRLVEEAKARFDPEQTEAERVAAADRRRVEVALSEVAMSGTVRIDAEIDLADGLDLQAVLSAGAAELWRLGSTESLDVRRAKALGMLARGELALDLDSGEIRTSTTGRTVVLHAHVSETAISGGGRGLARVDEHRGPITPEQVKEWCGSAGKVVVRPVLDLAEVIHVDSYEIPDRLAEQVRQRDRTCVFPGCTRTGRFCDIDHIRPYDRGGTTSSDNLAVICRRHHRHKTFGGWSYWMVEPGMYVWRSPLDHVYVRDRTGTTKARRG